MIMVSPNDTISKNLNGNISHSEETSEATESDVDLLEAVKAFWLVFLRHVEATVDGFKLDIKLAAYSLMALLITGIVVAALLVGLWFLGMVLLFTALTVLQVPMVAALLVIVLIQLLLLFLCHRFSKRMLNNFNFKAIRAALADKSELR